MVGSRRPRSNCLNEEDPRRVAEDIAKDIIKDSPKTQNVTVEIDRTKAIDLAINQLAQRGDWVVACGKGHEESMNMDGFTETPWSDHEAMQSALEKKV